MAVKLRLARGGSKKRPFYSIVAADERSPRDGRYIEKLGTFNPMLPKDAERVVLDTERAQYWLSKGAQTTDRVARIMDGLGLLKREARNNPEKAKPGKKAQERVAEKAQKAEDAVQAEADAKEAAKAAEAAAAEEAKAAAEAPAEAPAEEAPAEEAAPEAAPEAEAAAEEAPEAAVEEAPAEEAAEEKAAEEKAE